MGLDIELCRVLNKGEVAKLKNKYEVTDLVHPEKDDCKELKGISFISINSFTSCETNFETLDNFKHCLTEKEMAYYNVQAMILKGGVETKYSNLSDYYISGFLPSDKGVNYTKYQISHMKDEDEKINLHFTDDEIEKLNYKKNKFGIYIKDVQYVQRRGVKITKALTGKLYRDSVFDLFISTQSQLEKLKKCNTYEDSVLKGIFKIPKNCLLRINW